MLYYQLEDAPPQEPISVYFNPGGTELFAFASNLRMATNSELIAFAVRTKR
jgi:hypothetical protein